MLCFLVYFQLYLTLYFPMYSLVYFCPYFSKYFLHYPLTALLQESSVLAESPTSTKQFNSSQHEILSISSLLPSLLSSFLSPLSFLLARKAARSERVAQSPARSCSIRLGVSQRRSSTLLSSSSRSIGSSRFRVTSSTAR